VTAGGHPEIPALLLVTGPPAAGKTTIAAALAERLDLPLLAKDTLKEALAGPLGVIEQAGSRRLGAAVFELLAALTRELLVHGVSLAVEGNFDRASPLFHDLPPACIVQVYVSASPEVLHGRLLTRDANRHPVHYDREAADEIVASVLAGRFAPLPLDGALVQVETTEWPEIASIIAKVEAARRDVG
jgi:predicted kinase